MNKKLRKGWINYRRMFQLTSFCVGGYFGEEDHQSMAAKQVMWKQSYLIQPRRSSYRFWCIVTSLLHLSTFTYLAPTLFWGACTIHSFNPFIILLETSINNASRVLTCQVWTWIKVKGVQVKLSFEWIWICYSNSTHLLRV